MNIWNKDGKINWHDILFCNLKVNSHCKLFWNLLTNEVLWYIWKARNNDKFMGVKRALTKSERRFTYAFVSSQVSLHVVKSLEKFRDLHSEGFSFSTKELEVLKRAFEELQKEMNKSITISRQSRP